MHLGNAIQEKSLFAGRRGALGEKIIISADDFGISRLASENILKLAKRGSIDCVEVMMSKNISSSYVEELLASGVGINIHLHLVKDRLDFWQEHARKLEGGAIVRGLKFLAKYALGITSAKNVEDEWRKQIKEFIRVFGRIPDGVSSHEHIHFFPPYFDCLLRLCQEFGISYVRFGKKNFANSSVIAKILNWLREKNLRNFHKAGLDSADLLISFDWVDDLNLILKDSPGKALKEIIFHPEKSSEFNILEERGNVC